MSICASDTCVWRRRASRRPATTSSAATSTRASCCATSQICSPVRCSFRRTLPSTCTREYLSSSRPSDPSKTSVSISDHPFPVPSRISAS